MAAGFPKPPAEDSPSHPRRTLNPGGVRQGLNAGTRSKGLRPRLPLTASPSVWLNPPATGRILLACCTLITPLLRCDSRSRYCQTAHHHQLHHHRRHRPPLRGRCLETPHLACTMQPNCTCSQLTGGVPWASSASGKPPLWVEVACMHSDTLVLKHSDASAPSGRRHMRCPHPRQSELAHIAICQIADPHPP